MPDPLSALLAVVAGTALGAVYFGGLWWTVRRADSFRRPAFSMLVSALVRMTVALSGFYLVAGGNWQRLLLCLAGFIGARAAVSWQVRSAARIGAIEALHAP